MEGIFYYIQRKEYISLLRFYDDFEVIEMLVGYTEEIDSLLEGFDRNHIITKLHPDIYTKGKYEISENEITFSLPTSNGNADYNGIVKENEIVLIEENKTTGYKSKIKYNSIERFPEKNDIQKTTDEYYPIILIPNEIRKRIEGEVSKTDIYDHLKIAHPKLEKLKEPERPKSYKYLTNEVSKFENNGCTSIAVIPMVIFFGMMAIYCVANENFLLFLLFIILTIISARQLGRFKSEEKYNKIDLSKEEHQKLLDEFENNLSDIKAKNAQLEKDYYIQVNKINSLIESELDTIKKDIYYKSLPPISKAIRNIENIKRGKTELMFLNHLVKKFGSQIKVDISPDLESKFYFPDYAFICEKTGLHINIEIDEPYTLSEKKPIHYIGSNDDERNRFFLEQNWCVIRFSEKQILEQTDSCIELISNFINALHNKTEKFKINLIKDKRWSYEEALIMSYNNSRNGQ